jgi:biotin operon repressor
MTPDRAHNVPSRNLNEMIHTSISEAFYNKKNLTKRDAAFTTSFSASIVTEPQLIQHITGGGAFTPAIFDGNRKRANFVSSQIIALDLDNGVSVCDALTSDDIAAYAVFVGATVSSTPEHPRSRVLFVLDRPVTDADEYEALVRGALHHFAALEPDAACKDAARFYYGAERDEYVYQPGRALPVDLVRSWVPVQKAPTRTPLPATATRYATVALEAEQNAVSAATEGHRHNTLLSSALRVFGLVKADALDVNAAKVALKWAATMAGLPERETESVLSWSWDKATARHVSLTAAGERGACDAAREASYQADRHDVRLFDALQLAGVRPGTPLSVRGVAKRLKRRGLRPSTTTIMNALAMPIFDGGVMPTADRVATCYEIPDNLRKKSTQLDIEACRTAKNYRDRLQVSIYASLARRDGYAQVAHKTMAKMLGVSVSTVRRGVDRLKEAGVIRVEASRRRRYEVVPGAGDTNWRVQQTDAGPVVDGVKRGMWHFIRQAANRYFIELQAGVTQMNTLLSSIALSPESAPNTTTTAPTTAEITPPATVTTLRQATNKLRRYRYGALTPKKRRKKNHQSEFGLSLSSSQAPAPGAMSGVTERVLESFAAEFDAVITPLGGSA